MHVGMIGSITEYFPSSFLLKHHGFPTPYTLQFSINVTNYSFIHHKHTHTHIHYNRSCALKMKSSISTYTVRNNPTVHNMNQCDSTKCTATTFFPISIACRREKVSHVTNLGLLRNQNIGVRECQGSRHHLLHQGYTQLVSVFLSISTGHSA